VRKLWVLAIAAGLIACVPVEDANKTFGAIDEVWHADNVALLKTEGRRGYKAGKAEAVVAAVAALESLQYEILKRDDEAALLAAAASAPAPLDRSEWQQASDQDIPRARQIVRERLGGFVGAAFELQPELYWVVFYVGFNGDERGVGIATDARLQLKPESVYAGSKYPPPAALRLALAKFWTAFEDQLRARNLPLDRLPLAPDKAP
jgi:hypothetical protein